MYKEKIQKVRNVFFQTETVGLCRYRFAGVLGRPLHVPIAQTPWMLHYMYSANSGANRANKMFNRKKGVKKRADHTFFWCYRSEASPVLIDMSVPGLFKIPGGSREAFPSTLESYCHPGPSILVARRKSGVPTVQKSQGRKWDIQLRKCGPREVFAEDLDVFRTQRDRQTTD